MIHMTVSWWKILWAPHHEELSGLVYMTRRASNILVFGAAELEEVFRPNPHQREIVALKDQVDSLTIEKNRCLKMHEYRLPNFCS